MTQRTPAPSREAARATRDDEERGSAEAASDDPRPGFRWPVGVTQVIAAPPGDVWAAISEPGNLQQCHPFCAKNPVHVWPGPDSRDEIHYLSGWVFEREFLRWIDNVGYDLEIGRRGGRRSLVSWRILPRSPRESALRITVYPHVLQGMPVVVRWLPHVLRLRPMLRSYLLSVVRGFDWYITRGEAVPRNQFGKHPWFSESSGDVAESETT